MLRQPTKNQVSTLQTAVTGSSNSGLLLFPEFDFNSVTFKLNVTGVTGTSPTLDLVVQTSNDGGTTLLDCVRFAQITATTTNAHYATAPVAGIQAVHGAVGAGTISASAVGVPILGRAYKAVWTIGGTSPAFTFELDAILASQG